MDKQYIMALDQGTTSSRCILFDRSGQILAAASREFSQIYPQEGWVEHDPMEIWSSQVNVAQEALLKARISATDIAAIGITNQRETTIVWDANTGEPIYNAIVWQCRRTSEYCDKLKAEGHGEIFRERTGLILDAYFSGTKIRWILDNVPGAREKARHGDLRFGTVETWLIWKLTGGAVYVTDYTNASRTLLFNIHTLQWDSDLMKILDIPGTILPQAVPCAQVYGTTKAQIFGAEIPIAGAAGDQQASLFGQACFSEGDVKHTYGTGGFMLMNTGLTPAKSGSGLLTTIAWGSDSRVSYALEGSVFVAGAAIQWLRDEVGLLASSPESEAMALAAGSNGGVYMVPAFVGLGAPHWDSYARGTILGLTRGSNKNHIVRAALESIAYQSYELLQAMRADAGREITSVKVDGGAAANDFLMQFQADILGIPVRRAAQLETTALGAAYLAGLAVGYWNDIDDITANWQLGRAFSPAMKAPERERLLANWGRAVNCARGFVEEK
ncbi:MAG: glycerol kinase GlpK [Clostridiales Family XIII bacterium]|jgi:glycerol kinase|nr:glycerol kinase GlpK [Clostridiales Family XIII bacterium]